MIFRFDNFLLDTNLRELRSGADTQSLEPQVFDLVVYLVKNRDRVISKEELIQSLWGGRLVSDATINSRINAARRALRDTGKQQSVIRTFPKRGVRFVAKALEDAESPTVPASAADSAELSLPENSADRRPRIAVLPFASTDNAVVSLSIGLAKAIELGLSGRSGVEVISQDLAARLGPDLRDLATYGIDYVLAGTVERSGVRLRVSAVLSETRHGRQIWVERYNREMGEVLGLEDELAHLILMAMRWKMAAWDGQRIAEKTSATSTGDRLAQAARHFFTTTPDSYEKAEVILDAVLRDEPRHPMALGMRAFALFAKSSFGVLPLTVDERTRATRLADLALEQQQGSDFLHWVRGTLALYVGNDHDFALRQAARALEINAHYAPALRLKGETLSYAGQTEQGIPVLEELLAADRNAPASAVVCWALALAYFDANSLRIALDRIDAALSRVATMPDLYLTRAAILYELNRMDEAQSILRTLQSRHPELDATRIRVPPYKDSKARERYVGALRQSGLS